MSMAASSVASGPICRATLSSTITRAQSAAVNVVLKAALTIAAVRAKCAVGGPYLLCLSRTVSTARCSVLVATVSDCRGGGTVQATPSQQLSTGVALSRSSTAFRRLAFCSSSVVVIGGPS